jgi:hypothetical protein
MAAKKVTTGRKTKTARQVVNEEPKRGRRSPLDDLTDRQKEQLAKRVIKLRQAGTPWDGDEGIIQQEEYISSAGVGRKLLREYGAEGMIRERVLSNGGGSKAKSKPAAKGKAKPKPKAKAGGKRVVVRGKKRTNP